MLVALSLLYTPLARCRLLIFAIPTPALFVSSGSGSSSGTKL